MRNTHIGTRKEQLNIYLKKRQKKSYSAPAHGHRHTTNVYMRKVPGEISSGALKYEKHMHSIDISEFKNTEVLKLCWKYATRDVRIHETV